MIIRCDNCSVSLQLDESKVPNSSFTVRCPRCQNMIRVNGKTASSVQQLETDKPAPAVEGGKEQFSAKESEFEINNAMRSLLAALQKGGASLEAKEEGEEKPRRALLCLGAAKDAAAKLLVDAGYKVYIAQNPAQANERLREGKTEILIISPDFAPEFGGAAIIRQKLNSMYSSERRRLFVVSLEDGGTTMSAFEAFVGNLNLIVNTKDLNKLPLILNRSLRDFNELYYHFNQALKTVSI